MHKTLVFGLAFFIFWFSPNVFALKTCPSGKDVINSDTPTGLFAKTIWMFRESKFHETELSESILIFSKEKVEAQEIQLKGYIWWFRANSIRDCSTISGRFIPETRTIELRIVESSSMRFPSDTWLDATVETDGNSLQGKMFGHDKEIRWSGGRTDLSGRVIGGNQFGKMILRTGEWQAVKIYPAPAEVDTNTQ